MHEGMLSLRRKSCVYSNSCVRTIAAVFLVVNLLNSCLHVILRLHALILERGNTYETGPTESELLRNHDDPACELSDTLVGSVVLSIVQTIRILFFAQIQLVKEELASSVSVGPVCALTDLCLITAEYHIPACLFLLSPVKDCSPEGMLYLYTRS